MTDGDILSDAERLRLFEKMTLYSGDGVFVARAARAPLRTSGDPIASDVSARLLPQIVFANEALCRLLGFEAAELLEQNVGFLIGRAADAPVVHDLLSTLAESGAAEIELTLGRGDGRPIQVLVRLQSVLGDRGEELVVGFYRDFTDRVASEHWFETLIENVTDLIVVVSAEGTLTYISPAAETLVGYRPAEGVGRPLTDFLDLGQHPDLEEVFTEVITVPGAHPAFGMNVRAADGSIRLLQASVTNRLDDPLVRGLVVACRDTTDQDEAEHLLAEQAGLLESVARGAPLDATLERLTLMLERRCPGAVASIGVLDDSGSILHSVAPSLPKEALEALDRSSPHSALGRMIREPHASPAFADIEHDRAWSQLRETLVGARLLGAWLYPLVAPGDGHQLGLLTVFRPTAERPTAVQAGVCERVVHLAALAVERSAFEDRLRHQALHDALTSLPNRTMLLERITELLEGSGRLRLDAAALFVDLDMFKVINDSLGHAAGDEVLEQAAYRFRAAVRPSDFVARFGGDEFVVLSEQVGGVDGAIRIAERLAATLEKPFSAAGASVVVTASIGIARAVDAQMDAETLIRNADVAMYRAKELGRDGFVLFEESLYRRVAHRLALEQELRQALTDDLIEVWFQPQVRLTDGVIVGVEALARWPRTSEESISPGRFIPVAEETGLIVTLGRDVLARACRQASRWRRIPALKTLGVTVNVSARQLTDAGLCDMVIDLLAEHGLDPSALCLEVTESALVRDLDRAVLALDKLHGIGVRLAIDDFGTGYATLEHVRSFSMADELKIDQSFVADLERDLPQDRAIVSASVVLAHALGMSTVAEGVETPRQLAVLTELGCDLAQGFLFSPALPAAGLEPLLVAGAIPLDF